MYHYDVLGAERFQELCQALLVPEHPNLQCLPVGQPDGGRDALVRARALRPPNREKQKGLTVFQIKYSKKPQDNRSERDFIKEIVKLEKSKIERLKKRGLENYYIITNLRGTAHLDAGSIDKVDKALSKILGVNAYCWWRDDLDRRIDNNQSVKWSYPEILKATDLLGSLVSGKLGEHEERRKAALTAYLASQYEDEKELKFKQTDLRSTMTDLFVDLPLRPTRNTAPQILGVGGGKRLGGRVASQYWHSNEYRHAHSDRCSAETFLDPGLSLNLKRVVLEGAPGQGKSTVTQYVCQVLRMRLLNKSADYSLIPKKFRQAQLRIPFRIDLRDLAKWISGRDPFKLKTPPLTESEPISLEGFVAGQVRSDSGGHEFSVSDLSALAKSSHILLALDGFDEVADVALRDELVSEITKGIQRLTNAGEFSVQTIVTSRPAAFAKSIRFPSDEWTYLELVPLARRQVDEYTKKWMLAKGLKESEKAELSSLLDTKLGEAHTQFLAKNPMQLTILLTLIYNRGASLPEKRTAMYDAYMDLFFNRESEKSAIVREHRDLLIDIHRYLAWVLQTAAEAGGDGSVEQDELRKIVLNYLDEQGENTSIVGDLFSGVIERVGALVSRVEGTFEFEVQPLREYFVARHLYDTAPYSPPGNECGGTKIDRFDALVRNPYWLNVTRFYGGCFSKGEIPALVEALVDLSKTAEFEYTSHPRTIALLLLGDWVFTQDQSAVNNVVEFISKWPKLKQLLANAGDIGAEGWSRLPDRSGRMKFVEKLWLNRKKITHPEELYQIANAITQNTDENERFDLWLSARDDSSVPLWANLATRMQIIESTKFREFTQKHGISGLGLTGEIVSNGRFDHFDKPYEIDAARAAILSAAPGASFYFEQESEQTNPIEFLATALSCYQYTLAFQEDTRRSLNLVIESRLGGRTNGILNLSKDKVRKLDLSNAENEAFAAYADFQGSITSTLARDLSPWKELVDKFLNAWGHSNAIYLIASMAANVASKTQLGVESAILQSDNLVQAFRFLRLKSGAPRWWKTKLQSCVNRREKHYLLLSIFNWGSAATLEKLAGLLSIELAALSLVEWEELFRHLSTHQYVNRNGKEISRFPIDDPAILSNISSRFLTAIGLRTHGNLRFAISRSIGSDQQHIEKPEIDFAMDSTLSYLRWSGNWTAVEPIVKSLYARSAEFHWYFRGKDFEMPKEIALIVSENPIQYPLSWASMADDVVTRASGKDAQKLQEISLSENWF